ncbi:glucokinase [Roseicyclus sp. F158]|uniref:Glucokinase n=1 Tax=Tropicimonas omnivorans TaxID=3075590 RepID=A0ABU3DK02_9RHOB|nr:glucokinase [Roseicyclus sp. F158]MDT0683864.1 glucokinase [Roseicyclus sp. F158]
MSRQSLVADIGGTNTRVALARDGVLVDASTRAFRNSEFGALEPVLRQFIEEAGCGAPDAACIAMAGPVFEGRGKMTNLDWVLDVDVLARATGARTVALLNDLQAQGHALGHLSADRLHPIIGAHETSGEAAQLVVGVGTGFNAAPVWNTDTGRYVPPSECGHASLPARRDDDRRLAAFVEHNHGFASIEDVLSGRGLERIHAWLCSERQTGDGASAAKVMQAAETGGDPCAQDAVATFVRLLGNVTGDLALTHLPFGGIYLIGGVARAMVPHMHTNGFVEAFRDKGRFSTFMERFGVTVVEDDYAALIGSIVHLEHRMAHT